VVGCTLPEDAVPLSDILVCLDETPAGDGRLKLAARLAREHGAQLLGAFVGADEGRETFFEPRAAAEDAQPPGGAGLLERGSTAGMSRVEQMERRFRETLLVNAIDGDWYLIDRPDIAELLALATSVDLAILGQFSRETHSRAAFRPEDIAVACGRPVLIVPYAGEFSRVGEHVLIAWDGTREAIRALNDALPLLAAAKTVTVMTVLAQEGEGERVRGALRRAVRHLERHGIAARPEESTRGGLAVSDVLLSRAADLGADMIVAGAYHHSQLREALLGGVSRELLRHMTVPLLMSH
jgi:nucleotide-binding universal stress UspA family protein